MKLKPVVASVVMLGLMAPTFAKSSLANRQAMLDGNSVTSSVSTHGWFNRINVGGKGSVVGVLGNRSPAGTFQTTSHGSDLYVNNFNLLLNAKLSSWSKASANFAYLGAPIPWSHSPFDVRRINHQIVADEFYVTIGNLARNPFYLKFGKGYLPFGYSEDPYTPWQIMSPVQMLSQMNYVMANAGLSSDFGLYANLFAFRGEAKPSDAKTGNIRNFGAKIGYYDALDQFKTPSTFVNLAVSYIHNVWDSYFFGKNPNPERLWGENSVSPKVGHPGDGKRVGAIHIHGSLSYKAFSVMANWITALEKMVKSNDDSQFWALDATGRYKFKSFKRNSRIGVGVHWTGNASWMATSTPVTDWARIVPKWRVYGEYKIDLLKNTALSLVVSHGKSHDFGSSRQSNDPNPNKSSTIGLARLMVQL